MRYQFFPGSELSPPRLLGGIVDLDRPQHVVANVFIGDDSHLEVKPINELPDQEVAELEAFAETLPLEDFARVRVADIMSYTTRRRAMC